jgi:hypothetical protein
VGRKFFAKKSGRESRTAATLVDPQHSELSIRRQCELLGMISGDRNVRESNNQIRPMVLPTGPTYCV